MLKIAILGAAGRMGRTLIRLTAESTDLELVAATESGDELVGWDAGESAGLGTLGITISNDLAAAVQACDVAIDFTLPSAVAENVAACVSAGVPMIMGTTGLNDEHFSRLTDAAASIPLVYGRNMSVGITLLTELARIAARTLGTDYDVEITETHHRHKLDAPSGTALQLGESIAEARGTTLDAVAVFDRRVNEAARVTGSIGFQSIRAGSVVGDHSIMLAADEEVIELRHRAMDRAVFARGALRAARWIVVQPPGLYGMLDVLGLARR
jgi:4-hydroxy-tetrahydrodipicolinate reductase